MQVYWYIEPLCNDFQEMRVLHADGSNTLTHVDELAEAMPHRNHLFALPWLPKRIEIELRSSRRRCIMTTSWTSRPRNVTTDKILRILS